MFVLKSCGMSAVCTWGLRGFFFIVLDGTLLNSVPFYAYQLPDMLGFMLIIVAKS
jgi:hypothetical protein